MDLKALNNMLPCKSKLNVTCSKVEAIKDEVLIPVTIESQRILALLDPGATSHP